MKYFELTCKAYLKKDINFKESFEAIAKYISFAMAKDMLLKEFHSSKGYKFYVFNTFYPIEKDKIYKQSQTYTFKIRSLHQGFISALEKNLRANINNSNFLVVETKIKEIKQFFIKELYSITPVITTVQKGLYWTIQKDGDILKLQRLLQDNLEKKYQSFFNQKITPPQNFIQLLELKNQKPQSIWTSKNGKSFRFLGNKFKIIPNEDKVSQKLAFIALAAGLGEKNAFGGGFCLAQGI